MSYILEALRRSERERQHMAPPSIHTSHTIQYGDMSHTSPGLLKWVAIVLLAGAAITAAILWTQEHPISPVDQAGMPREPALAKPEAPAPRTVPSRVSATTQTVHPPEVVRSENPSGRDNSTTPQQPADGQQAKAPSQTTPILREPIPAVPVKQDVPAISQLPVSLQNALPSISIAGHIYADAPAARMVMVNGKITHEGDTIAPGLTLETITPGGIILKFQETRFHMGVFQHWPPGG